jgi:hypothetical protein
MTPPEDEEVVDEETTNTRLGEPVMATSMGGFDFERARADLLLKAVRGSLHSDSWWRRRRGAPCLQGLQFPCQTAYSMWSMS